MRALLIAILLTTSAHAQIGGTAALAGTGLMNANAQSTPAISAVVPHVTATTIEADFLTSSLASASLSCGAGGNPDGGYGVSLAHQQIVTGLAAATQYTCTLTASNASGSATAQFTATTGAIKATTPVKGVSYSAIASYNSINSNNKGCCDTFYNAIGSDGVNYLTNDDTVGFQIGGAPASPQYQSGISLAKVLQLSPLAIQTTNFLSAYNDTTGGLQQPDQLTQKDSGLFALGGCLYMAVGRQHNTGTGGGNPPAAYPQVDAQLIASCDRGATWNNYQAPSGFSSSGSATAPMSAAMFGSSPSTFASMTFVMYGADDGSLGYLNQYTQQDNANAYVYGIANEGTWNGGGSSGGGNAFYLARVPRAKLARLQASDWQFYTGGDGSTEAAWSGDQTKAAAVLSASGKLGEPAVNYLPTLNRYLLLTFYYPGGAANSSSVADSVWLAYESPHPWGPWTLVNTTEWSTQGYYNPVPILSSGLLTGDTSTLLFTDDFFTDYAAFYGTMTVQH